MKDYKPAFLPCALRVNTSFYNGSMALQPANFRLETALLDGLHRVRERDGISLTEQVRRAIRAWLDSRGVKVRAARKQAFTRKRV
jgi:hypothetical protein